VEFLSPPTLRTPVGFSHAVIVEAGRQLVFVSGQIGMAADGVVAQGWEAQTRQVFANLQHALEAAGAGWADVVKTTTFVTATDELAVVRAVRDEFIDAERPPANSLVCVAALARPGILIEIEAIAAIG
jgi:enamine deaminase RidA (YjgF/YER057c/UK114 family)